MGALFMYRRGVDVRLEEVCRMFGEAGFGPPVERELGDFVYLHYSKMFLNGEKASHRERNDHVFAVGTFVYRGNDTQESLAVFLRDFRAGKVDEDRICGSFLLVMRVGGEWCFRIDGGNIQNLFFDECLDVISTSFLAVALSRGRLTVKPMALTENLVTGHLQGPDTLFTEISRFDLSQSTCLDRVWVNINAKKEVSWQFFKGAYQDCVREQVSRLERYFEDVSRLANRLGAVSGLTGGHDTRLIFVLAGKYFQNVRYYAHPRKIADLELRCAEELCQKFGLELFHAQVRYPEEMSTEEIRTNIRAALIHNDGLVREFTSWIQNTNIRGYKKAILGGRGLSMGGIGGEQYRNEEHYLLPVIGARRWILGELVYSGCDGYRTLSAVAEREFVAYYLRKLENVLGERIAGPVPHFVYKRYLNEVFVPGGLGLRNNVEGRHSHYLSPFADPSVAQFAYRAQPKLGIGLRFEQDMIRVIDQRAASVMSDEGYSYDEGEPVSRKVRHVLKGILPVEVVNLYLRGANRRRRARTSWQSSALEAVCVPLAQSVPVEELGIDRAALMAVRLRREVLVEMGALFEFLGGRVRFTS